MMGMNDESKQLKIALLIAGLMLCFAVIPMWPYGYYTLLRLVVCGVSVYAAYKVKMHPSLSNHFIPLVIMAVLFNPLIPVYLSRLIWLPIDLAGAVYFLVLSKKI